MGDFSPSSLFVSYSHRDAGVVRPLIEMNEDLKSAAWVDYIHTPPGSDWSQAHAEAISKCYRLISLWSHNAAFSREVEREWRWALKCQTKIVPVLLDDTPLPSELASIHAVSLREYITSSGGTLWFGQSPPLKWMGLGTFTSMFGAIFGLIMLIAILAVTWSGITSAALWANIFGWLCVPVISYFGLLTLWHVQVELTRFKLRYRLSRVVVSSLKEWGVENRATVRKDG